MKKFFVRDIKKLTYDLGEDGDIARVARSNTNHIFPTPVTYTKVDGEWHADKWYRIAPEPGPGPGPGPEPPTPQPSEDIQWVQGSYINGSPTSSGDPLHNKTLRSPDNYLLRIPLYNQGYSGLTLELTKLNESINNELQYQLVYYDSNMNYISESSYYNNWYTNGDIIVIPAVNYLVNNITDAVYVKINLRYESEYTAIVPNDVDSNVNVSISNVTYSLLDMHVQYPYNTTVLVGAVYYATNIYEDYTEYDRPVENMYVAAEKRIPVPFGARSVTFDIRGSHYIGYGWDYDTETVVFKDITIEDDYCYNVDEYKDNGLDTADDYSRGSWWWDAVATRQPWLLSRGENDPDNYATCINVRIFAGSDPTDPCMEDYGMQYSEQVPVDINWGAITIEQLTSITFTWSTQVPPT